jgi:hypothetical protein
MGGVQCWAIRTYDESENKRWKVVISKISSVGGVDKFHFKVIPEFCYKVDVTTAYLGDVKLAYPHEDGDQWLVKNVVGSCTLWTEKNLRVT